MIQDVVYNAVKLDCIKNSLSAEYLNLHEDELKSGSVILDSVCFHQCP